MQITLLWLFVSLAPLLLPACLLPEERERSLRVALDRRQSYDYGIPIGAGDRFCAGTIAPRGLGTQSKPLTTILSVHEIATGLKGLAKEYGMKMFTTPYSTHNGATISGGKVGGTGTCNNAFRIYLNAGIHARERGGPDGLLYFIGDLLYANRTNIGLKYGSKSYTNAQVKLALSSGIVFVPLSNPDGVAYDQSSNTCWRKNRNPKSSTGSESSIGVDLNRNFDFLWQFMEFFSPEARSVVASTNASSEVYHGTSAFSEPETKSVKWVMDTFNKVRWFVDLHSTGGGVLYSWGSDENQSKFPTMNFLNPQFNHVRGDTTDTPGIGGGYGEYIPATENSMNIHAARRIGNAMSAAAGRNYTAMPSAELYPSSGASDDYAYSRHFEDTSKNLIHSFTIEFGFSNPGSYCPLYPDMTQHNQNVMEIGAGFMELLLAANDIGLGDAVKC